MSSLSDRLAATRAKRAAPPGAVAGKDGVQFRQSPEDIRTEVAEQREPVTFRQGPEDIQVEPTLTAGMAAQRAAALEGLREAEADPSRSASERVLAGESRPAAETAAAEAERVAPKIGEGLGRMTMPRPSAERLPEAIRRLTEHLARNDERSKALQARIAARERIERERQPGLVSSTEPEVYSGAPPPPPKGPFAMPRVSDVAAGLHRPTAEEAIAATSVPSAKQASEDLERDRQELLRLNAANARLESILDAWTEAAGR